MSEDGPRETADDRLDAHRKRELVDALLESGAVRFGEFELAHGGTSDYYVDKYRFETSPRCLELIAEAFAARLDGGRPAGVALGAVPLVTATAMAADRRYVIVRKSKKDHGTGNRIEGPSVEDERVVVVEDVATTGTSAAEAVAALREAGAVVDRVLVVVDRREGATEKLAAMDCELDALLTAEDLLSAADRE